MPRFSNQFDKKYLWAYIQQRIQYSPDDSCWWWSTPYPTISVQNVRYSVVALIMWIKGKAPNPSRSREIFYCHRCDNGYCVNPRHVFRSTPKGNSQDSISKGRWGNQKKTHCRNGHPFNRENTYRRGNQRKCRACGRERYRRINQVSNDKWRGARQRG